MPRPYRNRNQPNWLGDPFRLTRVNVGPRADPAWRIGYATPLHVWLEADSMSNAASYRGQAEAFYELAHASDDAMGRLAYVLRAMECEARAAARLYG
jgi:hypothetical protein